MWDLHKPRRIVEYTPLAGDLSVVTLLAHRHHGQSLSLSQCLLSLLMYAIRGDKRVSLRLVYSLTPDLL